MMAHRDDVVYTAAGGASERCNVAGVERGHGAGVEALRCPPAELAPPLDTVLAIRPEVQLPAVYDDATPAGAFPDSIALTRKGVA